MIRTFLAASLLASIAFASSGVKTAVVDDPGNMNCHDFSTLAGQYEKVLSELKRQVHMAYGMCAWGGNENYGFKDLKMRYESLPPTGCRAIGSVEAGC